MASNKNIWHHLCVFSWIFPWGFGRATCLKETKRLYWNDTSSFHFSHLDLLFSHNQLWFNRLNDCLSSLHCWHLCSCRKMLQRTSRSACPCNYASHDTFILGLDLINCVSSDHLFMFLRWPFLEKFRSH